MNDERPFLDTITAAPHDWGPRLVFADWLDEQGDPRGEVVRLLHALTRPGVLFERELAEARLRHLVARSVPPIGPFDVDPVGIQFALIPPGTFEMGSEEGDGDEQPVRRVTLTRAFWIGIFPVTQRQWERVMGPGRNPSQFVDTSLPVESVTFKRILDEFLPQLASLTGQTYRLPTEAEWEYACRAGTTTEYYSGDGADALREVGWCSFDEGWGTASRPRAVGVSGYANAFGLYDMHGNMYDRCVDRYGTYPPGPQVDPLVPRKNDESHAVRGGAWVSSTRYCRSSFRDSNGDDAASNYISFRLVRDAKG